MYEPPIKYRNDTGAWGYWLTFSSFLYIFCFCAFYATVYVNSDGRIEKDDFLNSVVIWNAVKPSFALFSTVWIVFSLVDAFGFFVLVVCETTIFIGSAALSIKLLTDRFTNCNSPSHPSNYCNDLLYCCVYWDSVPSCAGYGPCYGVNVTNPGDLKPNEDVEMFGIFVGILFFLELFIIMVSFGALSRLKRLRGAAILTNEILAKYYENGEDEEDEESDDDDDDDDDEMDEMKEGEDEGEEDGNRKKSLSVKEESKGKGDAENLDEQKGERGSSLGEKNDAGGPKRSSRKEAKSDPNIGERADDSIVIQACTPDGENAPFSSTTKEISATLGSGGKKTPWKKRNANAGPGKAFKPRQTSNLFSLELYSIPDAANDQRWNSRSFYSSRHSSETIRAPLFDPRSAGRETGRPVDSGRERNSKRDRSPRTVEGGTPKTPSVKGRHHPPFNAGPFDVRGENYHGRDANSKAEGNGTFETKQYRLGKKMRVFRDGLNKMTEDLAELMRTSFRKARAFFGLFHLYVFYHVDTFSKYEFREDIEDAKKPRSSGKNASFSEKKSGIHREKGSGGLAPPDTKRARYSESQKMKKR